MTLPINIIVPVYRGIDETRTCLNSLLSSHQQTASIVTVIDDCSPEPEITAYLDRLAQDNSIQLLRNAKNLGFVATVNRGMQLHPECDIVLLNSDTIVANNWLDRLRNCAYSREHIASVSPFSNNATICSFPRFCQDNSLPIGINLIQLDNCFALANFGMAIAIPTTVGFCMYIRRAALNAIGLFDAATFGAGYGEENDFCMRARAVGWQHLLCADTFVYHVGNVSFGEAHNPRKLAAMDLLRQRHPSYESLVMEHINADPAHDLRLRAAFACLCLRHRPLILVISHNRQGGTLRHIHELMDNFKDAVQFLLLTPTLDGSGEVELRWAEHFKLYFKLDQDFAKLVALLRDLGVNRVHVHHTLGLPPSVLALALHLEIPWNFTVHDYYSICPQINLVRRDGQYCGEPAAEECERCLWLRPAPGKVSIQQWRNSFVELCNQAERCFTPSQDCTQRMRRYFPQINWQTAYHELQGAIPITPRFSLINTHQELRILVIGALSAMKGADVLEDAARDAKIRDLPITFILLGYAYRNLAQLPDTKLQVHGPYAERDLADLLRTAAPDIIWFPALWPETYSYTLSAALHYGAPIVAPKLGAFTERLAGRPWTWLVPWNWTPMQFNDFFIQLKNGVQQNSAIDIYAAVNEPEWNKLATFNYNSDYLLIDALSDSLPQLNREAIQSLIERYLTPRPSLSIASRVRGLVLNLLVYLRAAPWLRPVVRKIPAAWQTWAKNLLLRR